MIKYFKSGTRILDNMLLQSSIILKELLMVNIFSNFKKFGKNGSRNNRLVYIISITEKILGWIMTPTILLSLGTRNDHQ